MSAIKYIKRTVSLDGSPISENLPASFFNGENSAHTFIIAGKRDGEDVLFSGNVSATFLNPNDEMCTGITSGIVDGAATVTLSDACYHLEGRFTLTISVNGAVVYECNSRIKHRLSSTAYDPSRVIPNLEELQLEVAAMRSATAEANAAATAAENVDASLEYGTNSVTISVTGRDGTQKTQTINVTTDDASTDLIYDERLLNNGQYVVTVTDMENGGWIYSRKINNTKRVRNRNLIPISAGMQIAYSNPTYRLGFWVLPNKTSTNTFAQQIGFISAGGSGVVDITANGYLIILVDSTNDITVNDYDCSVIIYTFEEKTIDSIRQLNSYDIIYGYINKNDSSQNGVYFTWNGDECLVDSRGSASSGAANNIMKSRSSLPDDVVPGNTLYVKYKASQTSKVCFRIIFYDAENNIIITNKCYNDTDIVVPSNATQWNLALFVEPNTTVNNVNVYYAKILNAKTNEDLSKIEEQVMMTRGVLADGTDFDDVKQIGCYSVNSLFSYLNSPFPDGYGGTVHVLPGTANTILQMAIATTGLLKVRTGIHASFENRQWVSISGGSTNNYTFNEYQNTYNVTATPTITTDTNAYLAPSGDASDRTAEIVTMLNSHGVCRLGKGDYYVSNLQMPENTGIIGCGRASRIILSGTSDGFAIKMGSTCVVSNVAIYGATSNITPTESIGGRHGILWQGTATQNSVAPTESMISDVVIRNFSGGGITCYDTGTGTHNGLLVTNADIVLCGAGVNIAYYSEFNKFTNVRAFNCYYGCVDNGGNNNFANCDFSSNTMGLLIDNSTDQSPNNTHGSFVGCTFNHSGGNTGTAIRILGGNAGEVFTASQIFYGKIEIENSVGIRFIGANFGRQTDISVSGSTTVIFSDCTFRELGNTYFTGNNNVNVKFQNCYYRNGTQYPENGEIRPAGT